MISENYKKEYFAKVFTELLNQWKIENKKNQADFASIIGAHPNSISRYKNAEDFPNESTLGAIAKEFGVNREEFYPQTDEEKYLYDLDFFHQTNFIWMNKFENTLSKYGIDIGFHIFLTKATNNFRLFHFENGPYYEQLWLEPITEEYVKLNNELLKSYAITTSINSGYCDAQINISGKTKKVRFLVIDKVDHDNYVIGFTRNDLIHIKKLQDKTTEYLKLLNINSLIESGEFKSNNLFI